jgi:hypothetical protein
MLGATRHVSLPVWVVDCACAVMQVERSIAATRAVPLAGRSIVLSVCLEFDYSFSSGFSDRVVEISICGSSLFNLTGQAIALEEHAPIRGGSLGVGPRTYEVGALPAIYNGTVDRELPLIVENRIRRSRLRGRLRLSDGERATLGEMVLRLCRTPSWGGYRGISFARWIACVSRPEQAGLRARSFVWPRRPGGTIAGAPANLGHEASGQTVDNVIATTCRRRRRAPARPRE